MSDFNFDHVKKILGNELLEIDDLFSSGEYKTPEGCARLLHLQCLTLKRLIRDNKFDDLIVGLAENLISEENLINARETFQDFNRFNEYLVGEMTVFMQLGFSGDAARELVEIQREFRESLVEMSQDGNESLLALNTESLADLFGRLQSTVCHASHELSERIENLAREEEDIARTDRKICAATGGTTLLVNGATFLTPFMPLGVVSAFAGLFLVVKGTS